MILESLSRLKMIIFTFRELFIQAGVLNLRNLGAIERRIARTVEHPKYQSPFLYFDVSFAVLNKIRSESTIDISFREAFKKKKDPKE